MSFDFSDSPKTRLRNAADGEKSDLNNSKDQLTPPQFQLRNTEPVQKKEDSEESESKSPESKYIYSSDDDETKKNNTDSRIANGPYQLKSETNSSISGLPKTLSTNLQNSYSQDFSNVNIHKNSSSAEEVGAKAYTQGNNVHFAPGEFNPNSNTGKELIGHEFAHIKQQREGKVKPTLQMKNYKLNADPLLEKEADDMGKVAVHEKEATASNDSLSIVKSNVPENSLDENNSIIQRWANSDVELMTELHQMELLEVIRNYVMEDQTPNAEWPSRKEAIKQAIRDRLIRLVSAGHLEEIENLIMEVQSNSDFLLDSAGWILTVLRYYSAQIESNTPWSEEGTEIPQNPRLFAQIGAAISSHSLTVAIYTKVSGVEREFQRAAASFASDHQTFGLNNNDQLIVGSAAAIGVQNTQELTQAIQNIITQLRIISGNNNAYIDNLALFAHGVNSSRVGNGRSYFNLTDGHQITNPPQQAQRASDQLPIVDFANQMDESLSTQGRVVLYACELGDSFYGGENDDRSNPGSVYSNWNTSRRRESHEGARNDEVFRGNNSFADELRDALNADGQEREVWGHRTTGHTTRNATWRQFESNTTEGAGNVFGEEIGIKSMTDDEAHDLNRANMALANITVRQLVDHINDSDILSDTIKGRLESHREGVRGWIARELPFAPTPIVTGDPPVIRREVISFFESRAISQMRD